MATKTARKMESRVENILLARNGELPQYKPTEKIRTYIVENFPELGKLAALRFIEWAQQNAGKTVSLPTGKTPEHFIKWVGYLLRDWDTPEVRKILEAFEIDPGLKPDMASFHFVQIDEFYPINAWQHNSFYHYVNKFYLDGFGFDPRKALLINPNEIGLKKGEKLELIWPGHLVDLSLRTNFPRNELQQRQKRLIGAIDQWCTNYEAKIRSLGGIGFFLGGIGPDGHIGFNVQGSDHYSTTRLTATNYETQAAAASDLGGIEVSRHRLVITIGLQTMVYNPDSTAVIIAAGEAKAKIVREAIESKKCNQVPASILQELPNAAFYLTSGAAKLLTERRYNSIKDADHYSVELQTQVITDLALEKNTTLENLKKRDFTEHRLASLVLKKADGDWESLVQMVKSTYQERILRGLHSAKNEIFLHTAPHHDDIMLGYLPYLVRLMREQSNQHYFNYLTSGFNAVTNSFMQQQTENAASLIGKSEIEQLIGEGYFSEDDMEYRNRDVLQYLDGLASVRREEMNEGAGRRFLRNLVEIYGENSLDELKHRLKTLETYFHTQYPGKKDSPDIQRLKGMVREWEADILWGYFGFSCESVLHSRLGFYKGDIFTEEPTVNRDVLPVLAVLKKVNPTVVSVAFDPEGSGPDTHYKVLQAISAALKMYAEETGRDDIRVWGYRNVWYRYHPSEADLFIPVTFNGLAILEDSFINSFVSQAKASFPSYEYDGPFSGLAKRIQVEQYQYLKTLLGKQFFYQNDDSRIRSMRGFVYLKEMNLEEFFRKSRELRKTTENISN